MNISVAMTTFNGEKYLNEQLNSILFQMCEEDEIVICDDGSSDSTLEIICDYMKIDNRIKLYRNNRKGVVLNFEDAIKKCTNEIIMLCDQDDIWHKEKLKIIRDSFMNTNKSLILHNAIDFTELNNNKNDVLIKKMKHGFWNNIFKSCYWGCCMSFKKELTSKIIPFPSNIVAHDQWIGLVAEANKESIFINKKLISHRRHNNNLSNKLTLNKKIIFRVNLVLNYVFYNYKPK